MAGSDSDAVVRLVIYACSILRNGVAIGPVDGRSNDELLRALSITLDAALPTHQPLSPLDGDPTSSKPELQASGGDKGCWASSEERGGEVIVLRIPDPEADLSRDGVGVGLEDCCKEAQRVNLDVTAKFFYLAPPRLDPARGTPRWRYEPSWTGDALKELERATGLETVDTMILSLPGLTFDDASSKGCQTDANADEGIREVADKELLDIWEALSKDLNFRSLGVSDFSKARLERLYDLIAQSHAPATNGEEATQTNGVSEKGNAPPTRPGLRKPAVNQVNTRGALPTDLREFAKEQDLKLFSHSDCSDILPPQTFALLMNKFTHRLPEPLIAALSKAAQPSQGRDNEQRDVRLQPCWVLKYTGVIKDRGVVADKGYIVSVSSI